MGWGSRGWRHFTLRRHASQSHSFHESAEISAPLPPTRLRRLVTGQNRSPLVACHAILSGEGGGRPASDWLMAARDTEEIPEAREPYPETRVTLLRRLPDAGDHEAWEAFVDLYGPIIFSFCRHRGCPESDAGDIVQEVLATVARRIHTFEYNPLRGRFRGWLYAIVKNRLIDQDRRRSSRPVLSGGDYETSHTAPQAGFVIDPEEHWEREYRRHLFQAALPSLRSQFNSNTWEAFRRTALEEEDPARVALDLNLSLGAVYIAKSRVLSRLRERVRQLEQDWERWDAPGVDGRPGVS